MDPLTTISTRRTPQSEQADPRQQLNNAGGYTFTLDPETRLRRFLTLGTDGATYYTSARDLSLDNAAVVLHLAATDHQLLVDTIVEISTAGRAPRQNPALFALAIACSVGGAEEKDYALRALPQVARIGTHLFIFARYVEQFRGWGRGLRRAIDRWYTTKESDALAYQVVKYRQREGWSHRDLLRLAHPKAEQASIRATFDWVTHGTTGEDTPRLIEGFLKTNEENADVPALVTEYGLSWEMLPDVAINTPATWEALLDAGVPQTALIRQLPRLTKIGLLPQMGGRTTEVVAQLTDPERLRRARVHPVSVLVAQRTYAQLPNATRQIVDALDTAFYVAFGAVEPANKRTLLALDVSGSMIAQMGNLPLSCREASAALALVTAATEPEYMVVGFTSSSGYYRRSELAPLAISPRQRLDDAIHTVSGLPFGGTDCALPMVEATRQGWGIDTFVIYTDNETWAGEVHPHQALTAYREESGIGAKLVVVGMTSTGFSIADPSDAGSLDVVGFDSAVPNLISDFSRGV